MRLLDFLSDELIIPSLRATTRDEAIHELIGALVRSGAVPPDRVHDVARAVLQREASQTTGLGSGVAIPHGLSEHVRGVVGALGVHASGVDFAAVDGQPVHLVILLVVPPNMFQAHIRTLAGIARVLNDVRLRRQIVTAGEAAAIMDVLVQREELAV